MEFEDIAIKMHQLMFLIFFFNKIPFEFLNNVLSHGYISSIVLVTDHLDISFSKILYLYRKKSLYAIF